MRYKKEIVFCIFLIVSTFYVHAEMSFSSLLMDYNRATSLLGVSEVTIFNYYTYSENRAFYNDIKGPWEETLETSDNKIQMISPEVRTSYNTSKPWGSNDGAMWQGKGLNTRISGGFNYTTEHLFMQIAPEVWFAQNRDFDIINTPYSSGYGDYWTEFDNLQRYGEDTYLDFGLGQSVFRVSGHGFSIGLSTENIILGPGQMNNIILGDNAGGFPHIEFGTDGKFSTESIGEIEFKWLWGVLEESEFFDDNPNNDYGWISGTYTAFSPKVIPNFTIGFNHQYYIPLVNWDGFDLVRGIPFLDSSNSNVKGEDMMISVPFSWKFPNIGFEFYGEWARNDNFESFEDLYKFPEHTHGYTLGINQIIRQWSDHFLMLSLEVSSLEQERTKELRAAGPWYRHGWAGWTQGYTNNGQLLGAAMGPGSDSQWLQVSWYYPDGMLAFSLQRLAHDKDYYYKIVKEQTNVGTFSEFNISVEMLKYFDDITLFARSVFNGFLDYNFVGENDEANFHFELGAMYNYE